MSIPVFIAGIITAAAAAAVGNFLLMRRMALVTDALSHVALPGIALGILAGINPLYGAGAFLIVGVLMIWFIKHKTLLEADSIVGVLFVTSLALGGLLIGDEELLESFFGSIEGISLTEAIMAAALSLAVLFSIYRNRKALILTTIDKDVARTMGISPEWIELLFLFIVAAATAAGINYMGVLLMSALLIVPAASARNFAGNTMRSFFTASIVSGVFAMGAGLCAAAYTGGTIEPGIAVVIAASLIFCVSVVKVLVVR